MKLNHNADLGFWQQWKRDHPTEEVEIASGHVIDRHRDVLARFSCNADAAMMMARFKIEVIAKRGT